MNTTKLNLQHRLVLFFIALLTLASCDTSIKTDKAEIGEAIENLGNAGADSFSVSTFKIDTTKSSVTWIGAKVTGRHNGVIPIQSGEILLSEKGMTGGSIIMDIASTRSTDKTIDAASNKKLTTHLRSPDFFDVKSHPTATFDFTSSEPYDSTAANQNNTTRSSSYSELRIKNPTHRITGNLTIKGKKKSITFPARVTVEDNTLKAKANFNIDRTQWGLIYRADQTLGNQTIHSDVNIGLDIVAKQ
ncbi:YceI family protein [Pontibacter sp. SGAir0037]|uniref:YceI family protein n=1 Tax=Pontibacter sp. SGAir0037 TaxID=2571030 RepID=UPI0010CD1552|nr:YceI family protein [Pontibacter sp. SGAir0037]QCR23800.1 YceI family protein [Pontibacter sp. SGAir0037]